MEEKGELTFADEYGIMNVIEVKQMKQKLTALLLAALLVGIPSGMNVQAADTEIVTMPVPFADDTDDTAFTVLSSKLEPIPDSLQNLESSESVSAWTAFHGAFHPGIQTELNTYPNVCSFLRTFAHEESEIRNALEGKLTADEITLLLNGTDEEILATFASPYTIVIGDKFYTPEWIYESSAEDITAAGITAEQLTVMYPYYRKLPLTDDAAAAFSQKLLSYTGTDPVLTGASGLPLTGDVNHDGTVGQDDAALLQQFLLGNADGVSVDTADMDMDGSINILDLAYLKKTILNQNPGAKIVDLPVIEFNQNPDYPTGCESAALYMLLKFYGVDTSVAQIVDILPKGPKPYTANGRTVGANPEREFVGTPTDSGSFGVFNEPIAKVASQLRSGAITKKGATMKEVLSILNTGNPVIAWYTTRPDTGIVYRKEWYDYQTGELIRWPGGEHAVVICGHDAEDLTYRDPNTGSSVTMSQDKFSEIFYELGGRIVYYEK